MATASKPTERRGKELYEVTRPLAKESRLSSWWYTISTFVVLGAFLAGAAFTPWWPIRLLLGSIGGLVLVRVFVLYHDFMHGAILRHSRLGKTVYYTFGLVALTPPRYWRYSHNYHHAHVSKPIPVREGEFSLLTADVGAMPMMTTAMWRQATFGQRLWYRVCRHPVIILSALVTVFFFSICLVPTLKNPRKFWDGALALLVHFAMVAIVWYLFGFSTVFFAILVPGVVAAALGAYLFFAQHNFEDMQILSARQWSHFDASLDSSSYMKLGPIGNWLTGNIGYHHVHHLNALIPFYRLPEAMNTIPELRHPLTTTLHPRDVLKCLSLSLWDEQLQRLVTFRQVART